jgi:hypothetical protein
MKLTNTCLTDFNLKMTNSFLRLLCLPTTFVGYSNYYMTTSPPFLIIPTHRGRCCALLLC